MIEQSIWGIHVAGSDGDRLYRERKMIGIGWDVVGDPSKIAPDREAFKAAVTPFFPNKTRWYIINAASQLYRFRHEMKVGDWIVYRSTYFDGRVHVGRITSDYRFDPSESAEYSNIRQVQWSGSFLPTRVKYAPASPRKSSRESPNLPGNLSAEPVTVNYWRYVHWFKWTRKGASAILLEITQKRFLQHSFHTDSNRRGSRIVEFANFAKGSNS